MKRAPTPTRERLLQLVDRFEGIPIVLVVDLVADRFVTGVPKRISREAPVLILRFAGEQLAPGGGANAAANVRTLGGRPLPVGVVGDDAAGRALLAELERRGIETRGIVVVAGRETPTKTRILAGYPTGIKQQLVRLDHEPAGALEPADLAALASRITAVAPGSAVAVLSDYGYGSAVPSLLPVLRRALGAKSIVLCDSRYRLSEFRGVDGATPNEEEAESLLGGPLGDDPEAVDQSGRRLLALLGARFLLLTRGSRGAALIDDTGSCHLPVHGTNQVADVTGAGDTVIGTFALALAADATPVEAAALANYAGGVVVMKAGTATLTADELRDAVRSDARPLAELRWAKS